MVDISQQQICCLPPHAGEPQQLLHGSGDLAAKIGQQHLARQNNVPGLVAVKAAGADIILHIGNVCIGHGLQGGVGGKQRRCDLVYPGVGALGGQADGNHQLVVLFIVQRTQSGGVALLQQRNNGGNFLFHGCPFSLS